MTRDQLIHALQTVEYHGLRLFSDQVLVEVISEMESFLYAIDDVHIDDGHIMIKVKEEMI